MGGKVWERREQTSGGKQREAMSNKETILQVKSEGRTQ